MELSKKLRAYIKRHDADAFQASLILAQHNYPELDNHHYAQLLEAWSTELRRQVEGATSLQEQINKLNHFLFEELGFKRSDEDYYDPRNSMINEVMDRRTGIPITLSVLYMTLGKEIGLDIHGISFPGHFLVKIPHGEGLIVIDPYHGGVSLSEEELLSMLAHHDANATIDKLIALLRTASPLDILLRMLRNLKGIYQHQNDSNATLSIYNLMLTLSPDQHEERLERGLLLQQMECPKPAIEDLRIYLKFKPDSLEAEKIQNVIDTLVHEQPLLH